MPSLDFNSLYRQHQQKLYSYVYGIVNDKHTAEDVLSSTWEKAFRARNKYSARKGTPQAWLYTIARNAALDELRRAKKRPQIVEEIMAQTVDGVEEKIIADQTVRQAMAALPAVDRELIMLRYWADLPVADIGKITGISTSNVTTRLSRALKKMKGTLND